MAKSDCKPARKKRLGFEGVRVCVMFAATERERTWSVLLHRPCSRAWKHKHKHYGGGKLKQTLRFLGQGFYNRARGAIFFSYFRILASIRIPKSWAFGQCILHDLEMNISAIFFVWRQKHECWERLSIVKREKFAPLDKMASLTPKWCIDVQWNAQL